MNRRIALHVAAASLLISVATMLNLGCTPSQQTKSEDDLKTESTADNQLSHKGGQVKIHFLEIVTPDADAACALYSKMHGVTFGDAVPEFGGARTAELDGGGMLSIRAPLRETENPVVRPYVLVEDIKKAVSVASKGGAVIAMPPTEIKGHGQFAIVIHGGIESGLWQN